MKELTEGLIATVMKEHQTDDIGEVLNILESGFYSELYDQEKVCSAVGICKAVLNNMVLAQKGHVMNGNFGN